MNRQERQKQFDIVRKNSTNYINGHRSIYYTMIALYDLSKKYI